MRPCSLRSARRASGQVVCWGWNKYGQLGDGTHADSSASTNVISPLCSKRNTLLDRMSYAGGRYADFKRAFGKLGHRPAGEGYLEARAPIAPERLKQKRPPAAMVT